MIFPDGSVRERGGGSKERRADTRMLVAGFRATVLIGPDGGAVNAALSEPYFAPCLGARDCMPTVPMAGGVIDGDLDDALAEVEAGTIYRLSGPGLRFGVETITIAERAGGISWWDRYATPSSRAAGNASL